MGPLAVAQSPVWRFAGLPWDGIDSPVSGRLGLYRADISASLARETPSCQAQAQARTRSHPWPKPQGLQLTSRISKGASHCISLSLWLGAGQIKRQQTCDEPSQPRRNPLRRPIAPHDRACVAESTYVPGVRICNGAIQFAASPNTRGGGEPGRSSHDDTLLPST